jgi:hypothetical protein
MKSAMVPRLLRELASRPGVRDYTLVCATALGMLTVLLSGLNLGGMALLPALVGLLGLLLGLSVSSTLVLLLVMLLVFFRSIWTGRFLVPPLLESPGYGMALAVTLLVYVASQNRLGTLLQHAVPPDYRRQREVKARQWLGRWLLPGEPLRRTTAQPASSEFVQMLVGASVFGLVGLLLWVLVSVDEPPVEWGNSATLWRLQVLAWLGLLLVLTGGTLLGYLRWAMASAEEARMRLQDEVWNATRGETRQITSWQVWARLRSRPGAEDKR